MRRILSVIALSLLLLNGCKEKPVENILPAQEYYDLANIMFDHREYQKAIEIYEKVFFNHHNDDLIPYSEAKKIQALYLLEQYNEVDAAAKVYLTYYPKHEKSDYIRFILINSLYCKLSDLGIKRNILSVDMVYNDCKMIAKHISNDSEYYESIQSILKKIIEFKNSKKLYQAIIYLKKNNPIAAITLLNLIIDNLNENQISVMKEINLATLYRLVEAYIMIGEIPEAVKYKSLLQEFDNKSIWYTKAQILLNAYQNTDFE